MTSEYNRLAGSGSYEWWVIKEDATGDYLCNNLFRRERGDRPYTTTVHLNRAKIFHDLKTAEKYLRDKVKNPSDWFIRRIEAEVSEYNKAKGETPRRFPRPSTVA